MTLWSPPPIWCAIGLVAALLCAPVDASPMPTALPVGRRNLGFSATDLTTPTSINYASTASPTPTSLVGDPSTFSHIVVTWVAVLAGCCVITMIVLWRCIRTRNRHGVVTMRTLFAPKGINVPRLHIKIDPPPPPPPMRPISSYFPPPSSRPRPRGRASRRAAWGPEIGEGGRRLSSGDVDDQGSMYAVDELPAYTGRDARPPAYLSADDSPTRATAMSAAEEDEQEAYELRTRTGRAGSMPSDAMAASRIAVPSIAVVRPDAGRLHRDSIVSVASTSADINDKEVKTPSSPSSKSGEASLKMEEQQNDV